MFKAFKSIKHGIKDIMKSNSSFIINGHHYNEDKLIAEGGYGYVYAVTNSKGSKYALKKMNLISSEYVNSIQREISIWKKLNTIQNVIKIIDYEFTNECVLILMELCNEGSLLDYINKMNSPISENEALHIIYQICLALNDMHNMNPPIAHRDIKIENVLKFGNVYKLCDFGSASSESVIPVNENKQTMRDKFDSYERSTTFIYRPPEMIDEYCNYIINTQVDVWAIGCILYTILFQCHPFQDAQKLTITSCHYYIPKEADRYSNKIIDFIRWMLTPNPSKRPTVKDIMMYIQKWNSVKEIPLCEEVLEIKQKQEKIRNEKKRKGNNVEVSEAELEKARIAIMKDMKKKAKYNRKKEDDLDDLFDDGDEYYKENPEKRDMNEKRMNMNKGNNNTNNNDLFGFNFQANLNNNTNNGNGNGNNNANNGQMLFDFNAGFSNQQNRNNNNNYSNNNFNNNNNYQQRQQYQVFQDNNQNSNYQQNYQNLQYQQFSLPQQQYQQPIPQHQQQPQQQPPKQNILDFFSPPPNQPQTQPPNQSPSFQFDKFFN